MIEKFSNISQKLLFVQWFKNLFTIKYLYQHILLEFDVIDISREIRILVISNLRNARGWY